MKKAKFKAEVQAGHKEAAVEVPFDPEQAWGTPPRRLWRGRNGHLARGTLNGSRFDSVIVPRAKRFYLLVAEELREAAGISVGDSVEVVLEPREAATDPRPPARRPARLEKNKRTKS
jgi:hypothetical protein